MAQKNSADFFSFRRVELFKDETIGNGAYGAVCKARCDKLDCAAKLLYGYLLGVQHEEDETETAGDGGGSLSSSSSSSGGGGKSHRTPLSRFKQECQFLSRFNHPNVVQYLGTYCDPNAKPKVLVLLMELMNQSLTNFLDKSPGPVPFHLQVDIGYDVVLALTYLHNNDIIHRDLSSNNVLLTASLRAKVSDFGMSTLLANTVAAGVGGSSSGGGSSHQNPPRPNSLTVCPGNVIYMPPEALDEPPLYTKSLDVFSFGVLMIQVSCRLFPSPTTRFTNVDIISPVSHKAVAAKLAVPEVERRQEHIATFAEGCPILAIVRDCLSDIGSERPPASQLCDQFEDITKRNVDYLRGKETATTTTNTTATTATTERCSSSQGNRGIAEGEMSQNIYELDDELLGSAQRFMDKIRQLEEQNEQLRETMENKEDELASNVQLLSIRANQLKKLTKEREFMESSAAKDASQTTGELESLRAICHEKDMDIRELNGLVADLTRENTRLREQIQLQDSTIADLRFVVDNREDYISSTKAHLLAEIEHNQKLRAQLDSSKKVTSQDSFERESLDTWLTRNSMTPSNNNSNSSSSSSTTVAATSPTAKEVRKMESRVRKKEEEVEDLKKLIAVKDAHITSQQELLQATEAKLKARSSNSLKPPIKPRSPRSPEPTTTQTTTPTTSISSSSFTSSSFSSSSYAKQLSYPEDSSYEMSNAYQKLLPSLLQPHPPPREGGGSGGSGGGGGSSISWSPLVFRGSRVCPLQAGSTAVYQGKVYCRPANRSEIFELCLEQRTWKEIERCPSSGCALANVEGVLTAVGGKQSQTLWSYVKVSDAAGGGGSIGSSGDIMGRRAGSCCWGEWTEIYPPMRVERHSAAVAYARPSLVVAGGHTSGWSSSPEVEVLDVTTHTWFSAHPLPYPVYSASAAICNGCVYVVGGYFEKARSYFSVISCPLSNLRKTHTQQVTSPLSGATNGGGGGNGNGTTSATVATVSPWWKTADLPVCRSTCINLRGKLAVVGGRMVNGCDSATVYVYSPTRNVWEPISDMAQARSECHMAVVATAAAAAETTATAGGGGGGGGSDSVTTKLVVVGGCVGNETMINSVEVGEMK